MSFTTNQLTDYCHDVQSIQNQEGVTSNTTVHLKTSPN